MASKVPAFTKTAVLQEVQHGDNTLRIVGYVDSIQGQKTVGQKRCLNLFKFVITNGEKKMKVLIWEDQIPLYTGLVKFHEIIEFTNIKAVAVDIRYHKIEENFLDYDLSIQRSTNVICHGQLNNSGTSLINIPEKIQIKYAAAYQGVKTVEGYLCVPFVRITTGQGTCSFASGAVSDGAYKLRLQVANYVETPVFVVGAHVAITGNVRQDDKGGSVFMQLEHMNEVKIIDETTLSSEQIDECFRRPLRDIPASNEMQGTDHTKPPVPEMQATHSKPPMPRNTLQATHSKPPMPRKVATPARVKEQDATLPRFEVEREADSV